MKIPQQLGQIHIPTIIIITNLTSIINFARFFQVLRNIKVKHSIDNKQKTLLTIIEFIRQIRTPLVTTIECKVSIFKIY